MKENKPNVHYIHYLSQNTKEQLVGAFFIIALLTIGGLIIAKIQSAKMFDDVITYHTYMKNAQGISTETLVNISGIEVGKVAAIDTTDDNKIHIEFFIYKSFENLIRTDSVGELSKLSIVGNAIIIINAGSPSLPLLPAESIISIKEPFTTDDLIEGIKPVINDLEITMSKLAEIIAIIDPQSLKNSSESLVNIMKNTENITHRISSGQGMLGKAIYDEQQAQAFTDTLNNFATSLSKIEQRINETGPVIKNLTLLSAESQIMVSDIRRSLDKLEQVANHLPTMVDDTQSLIQSTEETVQNLQRIWPLSSTIQQPDNALLIDEEGSLHD